MVRVFLGGLNFEREGCGSSEQCVGDLLRDLILFAFVHSRYPALTTLDYIRNRAPFRLSVQRRCRALGSISLSKSRSGNRSAREIPMSASRLGLRTPRSMSLTYFIDSF